MNKRRQRANRDNGIKPKWSSQEDEALMAAFLDRKKYREISALIPGKSRSAIAGRCQRLGLKVPEKVKRQRLRDNMRAARRAMLAAREATA